MRTETQMRMPGDDAPDELPEGERPEEMPQDEHPDELPAPGEGETEPAAEPDSPEIGQPVPGPDGQNG